jgi:hypothetical protein
VFPLHIYCNLCLWLSFISFKKPFKNLKSMVHFCENSHSLCSLKNPSDKWLWVVHMLCITRKNYLTLSIITPFLMAVKIIRPATSLISPSIHCL